MATKAKSAKTPEKPAEKTPAAKVPAKAAVQIPTVSSPILTTRDLYVIGDREGDPADHPLHRRQHAPATPEMIESVEQDGVRVPIQVASILVLRDETGLDLPIMQEEGWEDLFLVVDGVRRVDALKEVNSRLAARNKPEKSVKANVIEGGLMEAYCSRVIANDHNVEDPPSVRAMLMTSLATRRVALTDIGRWFAIGEKMARHYLKFNKTIDDVKAAVDQGKITLMQAVQWADLPPEQQAAELAKALEPPKKGGGGGGGGGVKGSQTDPNKPSRKMIRGIAALEGADEVLPKGFVQCCRWVDGSAVAADIPGLIDIIAKVKGKPAAKRGRKAKG